VVDVRAVIFDVGGVLVRTVDQGLRIKWEQALGLARGEAERIVFGVENGCAAQLGRISEEEHWRWVQGRLGVTDADLACFRRDFFANDRLDAGLLEYTTRLRARYHVGLLSNALANARRAFAEDLGFLERFDSITISSEEGVMKPDERIFRIALARAGTRPENTLFVDDTSANVEAAHRLGMVAVQFVDPLVARRELERLTGIG
jgi:HAD superfamily hydrolase (TIGR01509 family)